MNQLEWNPYDRNCPSRAVLDRLGDRWAVLVVGALSRGPLRFKELAAAVDGVSQKMLTQTLRGLERDGLLTRTSQATIPPRVDYQLTETGVAASAPMEALVEWAKASMPSVMASRERYDAAHEPAAPRP